MTAAIRPSVRMAVFLILGLCGACQDPGSTSFEVSTVSGDFSQFYESLLKDVSSRPGSRTSRESDLIRVDDPDDGSIYFFTTREHAAHPAIIKRTVVERDGEVLVSTKGWTGEQSPQFEDWLRAFQAQDRQMRHMF